jgi:hypothetical protein
MFTFPSPTKKTSGPTTPLGSIREKYTAPRPPTPGFLNGLPPTSPQQQFTVSRPNWDGTTAAYFQYGAPRPGSSTSGPPPTFEENAAELEGHQLSLFPNGTNRSVENLEPDIPHNKGASKIKRRGHRSVTFEQDLRSKTEVKDGLDRIKKVKLSDVGTKDWILLLLVVVVLGLAIFVSKSHDNKPEILGWNDLEKFPAYTEIRRTLHAFTDRLKAVTGRLQRSNGSI